MGNDCQYFPGDVAGLHCWQDYEDGRMRKGPWDCSKRYHWIDDNEECAGKWMPKTTIRWLLIAESPPCPKDEDEPPYIYRIVNESEQRPILEAIVSAFKKASGNTRVLPGKTDKLVYMKDTNGGFLMDLCCYSLNRLNKSLRGKMRNDSEYGLYLRLLKLSDAYPRNVENIVIVGKGWHENVLGAVATAGLGNLVRNPGTGIPFPDRYHYAECVDLLSKFFADPEYEKHPLKQDNEQSTQ